MTMSDAVRALLMLHRAPEERLKQRVYNITSFSISADEFRLEVLKAFPEAEICFDPHAQRQAIVDTWPRTVDDEPARRDWGWQPEHPVEVAFAEYLVPRIAARYG